MEQPIALLLRVGHGPASSTRDGLERRVDLIAVQPDDRGGQERRAADTLPAVHENGPAAREVGSQPSDRSVELRGDEARRRVEGSERWPRHAGTMPTSRGRRYRTIGGGPTRVAVASGVGQDVAVAGPHRARYERLAIGTAAAAGLLVVGLFALLARDYAYVRWPPDRVWFPDGATADVAFVPSGDPGERTRRAVALLKAGRVKALVFSGAGYGGDSGYELARWAVDWGAPPDRVYVEPNATTTVENVRLGRALLAELGAERVVAVTHRSHAPRVAWLFEEVPGTPSQVWVEPVTTPGRRISWVREALKMLYSRLELAGWAPGRPRPS